MRSVSRTGLRLAAVAACVCSALLADDGADRTILRGLRSDSMAPPASTRPGAALADAIRALRQRQLPRAGETARTKPARPAPGPRTRPATRPAEAEALSPEVLAEIAGRAKDLPDPTALADALFLAGRDKTAFAVYEAALASETVAENRAWLIFQMANCRREYDPAGCRAIYQRLLAEHPKSPWVPLAQTRDLLADWYAVNAPAELLAEEDAPPPGSK